MPNIEINKLRPGRDGITSSFEEFCCQLFRRAPEAPTGGRFRRIRGAGGDGGVEATWEDSGGGFWGLQAKFFLKLASSEKAQMKGSLDQAIANYPRLTRYTFCLPIALTAKKGAKKGKQKSGQHEKLTAWIAEWHQELHSVGRKITINFWDESELLDRLTKTDTTGGIRQYWFDQDVFSLEWFSDRLRDSRAQAGKRYTPELSVDTSLNLALEAFGRSETWVRQIESLAERFEDKLGWWRTVVSGRKLGTSKTPSELLADSQTLLSTAEAIQIVLDSVIDRPEILTAKELREKILLALEQAATLEPKIKAALMEEHGETADTKGFRQFAAEMLADFPMAPLDHIRDLTAVLREVEKLAFQTEGQLPAATAMLVHGPAGIGKTHGILEVAHRHLDSGLLSIVVFGEDFSDSDPWTQIASRLGLGASIGHDRLLDALDAAGEATGFPLAIFIDALNETTPDRRRWKAWLPPMLEQIARRRWLKLCVSCRDTYLREVIPHELKLPAIQHNGFVGHEYEAVFRFFEHYGLGPPAEPLMQEEFTNPLFLHLVCDAVKKTGASAIPTGRQGIRYIITVLLQAKNRSAAAICDYDSREDRVHAAVLALAGLMAAQGTRHISLADAKAIVDPISSSIVYSKSLFSALESESLIAVFEKPPTKPHTSSTETVRFTFERMGDHFIAEHLLSKVDDVAAAFKAGNSLHFLVANDAVAREHGGLLEALGIQIPEFHGNELVDMVDGVDRNILLGQILSGLQWRDPASVSDLTVRLVREALSSSLFHEAAEALFVIATRPTHPLNAQFLDSLLTTLPMLVRDPLWADLLETSFSRWTDQQVRGEVSRIIDAALQGRLDALPNDVAILWATILAWFCASPDRRIRDRSTKGLVKIFTSRPATIVRLLKKFARFEDEYISERVLVAAYGALLLRPNFQHLRDAASEIYSRYFAPPSSPPLNASLRDHGRLIIELAIDLGVAPSSLSTVHFRPPYASPWPLHIPTEAEVAGYAADRKRFPAMDLTEQFGMAMGTDFARYVIEPRVASAFDIKGAGLENLGLFRWFLNEAVSLGYPGPNDQCAKFDRYVSGTYGGGRGKPGWAERLGKKYYWIFLRRLVGQIADHVPRKDWSEKQIAPSTNLQALDLRDIDPTDLRKFTNDPTEQDNWFVASPYIFHAPDDPQQDKEWMAAKDLPNIESALIVSDKDGADWHLLDFSISWRGKRLSKKTNTYRLVRRNLSALTCPASDIGAIKRTLAEGGSLNTHNFGPHDYRGYLGEYPSRLAYRERFGTEDFAFEQNSDGITFEAVTLRQLKGAEWQYDYSVVGGAPSLLMPAPRLIAHANLRWDNCGSWLTTEGITQIVDPLWSNDDGPSLIAKLDYLDDFLASSRRALVIFGFQSKFVPGASDSLGVIDEETIFIRDKGKTKLIAKKVRQ